MLGKVGLKVRNQLINRQASEIKRKIEERRKLYYVDCLRYLKQQRMSEFILEIKIYHHSEINGMCVKSKRKSVTREYYINWY